jgi:hypothetical protein
MHNLQWTNEGNRYLLKNGDEVMVDLVHNVSGNDSFFINHNRYSISRKGFWNPGYEIEQQGKTVLQLTYGIWKSTGKIIFSDASEYQSDYQSKNGLKLRFLDKENEIMVFGIDFSYPQQLKMNFYVGIVMEDAEKLLILAALGMSVFSSVYREMIGGNDVAFHIV